MAAADRVMSHMDDKCSCKVENEDTAERIQNKDREQTSAQLFKVSYWDFTTTCWHEETRLNNGM